MDIPLVDMAPWFSPLNGDRRKIAAGLDDAFADVGFAIVTGHGLDAGQIRELRAEALEFFSLDEAEKSQWAAGQLDRVGWIPMGMEANGKILGEDTPYDLKETFTIHRNIGDHPAGWPEMVKLGCEHLEATTEVYETLICACAAALDLEDPEILVGPCRDAPNALNITWYPSIEQVGAPLPGQYRVGPHTDFGTMTLLDREPGLGCLQVQLPDDTWVDAPHIEDALIINVADLLALWSGGRWRSARHRVLPPSTAASSEQLLSLVSFCEARDETVIAPLLGSDAATWFEPVIAREWLSARIAQISLPA